VRCNQIFLTLAQNNGHIAAIASEELDEVFHITDAPEAKYLLVLDPLDGSNNLQINAPVATIFSVCLAPTERDDASILEAARHPTAAGICIYGLTTFLAMALENGVFGFTRDFISGAFLYTHGKLNISEKAPDVAINLSNREHW